jgi:flagellin
MAMLSIQTNVAALDAAMNVSNTQGQLSNTIAQLSSGYRINSASDDAAGLGIAENLEANIAQYTQAAQNTTDGQSVFQTASSSLTEVNNILTRMSSLAMEAANSDVNQSTTADANVTTEFNQLVTELTRINNDTSFNGTSLFSTATTPAPATFTFQVGIGSTPANDTISFTSFGVDATTLGVNALKLDTNANAEAALTAINTAIGSVSVDQANLGAVSEQLSSASNTIAQASQSVSAADAGYRDVNVATASANLSQEQVLEQSGIAVLASANQMPQMALKLLS